MTTQESEAPDLRLALIVIGLLLEDVRRHLEAGPRRDPRAELDLALRTGAVRAVVARLLERMGEADDS